MAKQTCRRQLAVNCKKLQTDNKRLVQRVQLGIKEMEGVKIRHFQELAKKEVEVSQIKMELDLERSSHTESIRKFKALIQSMKRWYQIILKF